ncbi:MAG: serine hydrolase [Bryobacteraceae bacterium]
MRNLIAVLLSACVIAGAQVSQPRLSDLDRKVKAAIRGFDGKVTLYAKNLDSGEAYGIEENEKVRTASTIKLPIMIAVYQGVADGKWKLTDRLTLREEDRVSGSGVLREFSAGVELPIRDVMHMMIVVSDNTATNLILERITADYVNEVMDKYGFPATRSMRKVRGDGNQLTAPTGWSKAGKLPENEKYGLGSSTPKDMVALIEKLTRGEIVSPEASKEMLAVLTRQQDDNGMARRLPEGFRASNKAGALDALRSDIGLVQGPLKNGKRTRIALAITVDRMPKIDYTNDNIGLILIAELTKILIAGLE